MIECTCCDGSLIWYKFSMCRSLRNHPQNGQHGSLQPATILPYMARDFADVIKVMGLEVGDFPCYPSVLNIITSLYEREAGESESEQM